MPSEQQAGPPSPGVQQAYDRMMREQVAPALRALGFTGTARIFKYRRGGGQCEIHWQKDGRQARQQLLLFTMNVDWSWGWGRISELMPAPATDTWWRLRAGEDTQPIADSVVSAVRCYALPAMQAGLDDLAHQPHPDGHWPRRFPAVLGSRREPDGGGAASDAWYLQPTGSRADRWFADLTSGTALDRLEAAYVITEIAASDARTVPALIDRLERDPSPLNRKEVASRMLPLLAREPLVRSALHVSAASDEAEMVRGAAFYALRLDLDRDPGREALARWPRDGGMSGADG